jgi:hypothetical protein
MIFYLIIVAVFYVSATILMELENFGWTTVLLIASVIGAQVFHVVNFWAYASTHALTTLVYVGAYVGIGVVWSFVKWFSFLMAFRDELRRVKENYQVAKDSLCLSGVHRPLEFAGYAKYRDFRGNPLTEKPSASFNKSRIISWMGLWPCSVIGTLLNDPVRRIFNFLFHNFKTLYQKMSDAIFANDTELK